MINSWKDIVVCYHYRNNEFRLTVVEISFFTTFCLQGANLNYEHEEGQIMKIFRSVIIILYPGIRKMSSSSRFLLNLRLPSLQKTKGIINIEEVKGLSEKIKKDYQEISIHLSIYSF